MYITPQDTINQIFSEKAKFQRWLDVEASLARAQAALGIIPQEVAGEISQKADVELLDLDKYEEAYRQTAHPMVALLRLVQPIMGKAGQYIHLGPTTHDIIDTGTMLALKTASKVIYDSLRKIEADLLSIVEKHADTLMAGRTHNIQAVPITFGFKAGIWVCEIRRNIERLKECRDRILVIQLSGAGGIMSALGPKGLQIQELVAKDLELGVPEIAWHASRDRLVEFANLLVLISLALGRIGQEIYLLMATEVGEVYEPWDTGMVGSSCMPHKINPIISQHMMSLTRKIRYNASLVAETAMVDHEWNLEHFISGREKLEEACIYMGELLTHSENMVRNMTVNPKRMLENLDVLKGLMQSESVMMELAKKMGKMAAHEIINEDAVKAIKEGLDFRQVLIQDNRVNRCLTEQEIEKLLDPSAHVGLAPEIARGVVAISRRERDMEEV